MWKLSLLSLIHKQLFTSQTFISRIPLLTKRWSPGFEISSRTLHSPDITEVTASVKCFSKTTSVPLHKHWIVAVTGELGSRWSLQELHSTLGLFSWVCVTAVGIRVIANKWNPFAKQISLYRAGHWIETFLRCLIFLFSLSMFALDLNGCFRVD